MDSIFDYKSSLNGIKANLFDIYENQEQIIGLEQDESKRNKRLNKFIEMKDIALMLLDEIESLYTGDIKDENLDIVKLSNPKLPELEEESKILNLVENKKSDSIKEDESTETNEENTENNSENVDDTPNLEKYYLDCDKKRVNFAYVPVKLFDKLKANGVLTRDNDNQLQLSDTSDDDSNLDLESSALDEDFNEEEINDVESSFNQNDEEKDEENEDALDDFNSKIIKEDEEKPRGIIVRSDQYMKLALSKHRQEGVIREAKTYRINEARKRQRENQKKELEKAKVDINI